MENLTDSFIRMEEVTLDKIFMEPVINRLKICQRAFDTPVRSRFPGKRGSHLEPVHFLAVEGNRIRLSAF